MTKLSIALIILFALSPVCLAESSPTDDFLDNLSKTWDSFLVMTEDAGKGISAWAQDSGLNDLANQTIGDITEWAKDSGLMDWAEEKTKEITAAIDEIGISEWIRENSEAIQSYADEYRPVVEAWLSVAGEEVANAWNTLMNACQHSDAEIEQAYDVVADSLESYGLDVR